MSTAAQPNDHYDVVILGGGLAGQTLARHLLLETERRILLLEYLDELPAPQQKVGESSVQLAGYYFSKVLDLEELLFHEHFMKYNLRFYWKSGDRPNDAFEDYSQAYIRPFSNIASYQLDRNAFEGALLERNGRSERFTHQLGARRIKAPLEGPGPHPVTYSAAGRDHRVTADWVVDTTGRMRFVANRRQLQRDNPIHHGAYFWWVDGLVDIEKLSDQSRRQQRQRASRRQTGHLPFWLATNHFMGRGLLVLGHSAAGQDQPRPGLRPLPGR
ncbi:MAG: tryptophan 7-halogenase [Acidobacteriota bacterium]